ncbi:MAG: hypothetical protein AAF387_04915 [Pseudomonadota bacterium]
MRDGIAAADRGLPSIAFVTADFWKQGNFVAQAQGMPDVPRIKLPHPVAGTGQSAMQTLAGSIVDEIISVLTGKA